MVLHQDGAPASERGSDPVALVVVDNQVGIVEPADTVGEEDPVVGEQREVGCRRAERRRLRLVAVDDRTDVGPHAVDTGMEDRFEVHHGVGVV